MKALLGLCLALVLTGAQARSARGSAREDYVAPPNPCDVEGGESLECWTCMNAASELDCRLTGGFEECQMEDPVCELEVHENKNGGVYQVTRMCKQRVACENRADNWQVCGDLDHNELCRTCGSDREGVDWRCTGVDAPTTTEAPTTTPEPCAPPEFPCDCFRNQNLACWTCQNEPSMDACQANGQLVVCPMSDPVCELEQYRNPDGQISQVTNQCRKRVVCEQRSNSPSGVCSKNEYNSLCRECSYGTEDFPSRCIYIPFCQDDEPDYPVGSCESP